MYGPPASGATAPAGLGGSGLWPAGSRPLRLVV